MAVFSGRIYYQTLILVNVKYVLIRVGLKRYFTASPKQNNSTRQLFLLRELEVLIPNNLTNIKYLMLKTY